MWKKIGYLLLCFLVPGLLIGFVVTTFPKRASMPNEITAPYANQAIDSAVRVRIENQRHTAEFDRVGVHFQPLAGPDWDWQLVYAGGGGKSLPEIKREVQPNHIAPGIVAYVRGGIVEQYLAGSESIEQQFLIPEPLALSGADLVIRGLVTSPGVFETASQGWLWRTSAGVVSLGRVFVYDAEGREIPAWMEVSADQTEIQVDGTALAAAAYPVTIDPEIGNNDFRISNMGPDGDTAFAAFDGAIAYNSTNNEYLVVWARNMTRDGEIEIFGHRIHASSGAKLGGKIQISDMGRFVGDPAYAAQRPAVAYNSKQNEYLVVWQGDDNSDSLVDDEVEIYGQRIDAATGAEIGDNDFRISDMGPDGNAAFDAFNPAVAYNKTDWEYLVVWQGDDDNGDLVDNEIEIYGQLVAALTGDEIGPNDFRISDMGSSDGDTAFRAEHPAVAFNATANEYLVVWQGDDNTGSLVDDEFEIYGQRVHPIYGSEVGSNDFRISDMGAADGSTSFGAHRPSVAFSSGHNEYLVVWQGDDDSGALADNEYEIHAQRVDDEGNEVGNDFRISDMGTTDGEPAYAAVHPQVAYDAANDIYLVVWRGDDDGYSLVDDEFEIYAQRVHGDPGAGNEYGSDTRG